VDTIVAISTSPGIGGIGIIRMSGEKCFEILKKIFEPKNKESNIKGYTIKYGNIIDKEKKEIIDEVLVSYFKAPKSYTTEDMCEINSHGGTIIMKQILELCVKNGAKMAEAGEFTKRAFLNGRIDLSQAEAVIDIINAKTEKEKRALINQLEGFLSREINVIKKEILSIMVDIEVNIDYPEYETVEVTNKNIINILQDSKNKLNKLKESFDDGKILRDGIKTAIIGKPNVGKSSLLNVILKEERAIVTEFEGTTRDTIEEYITIQGVPFRIIDTAGIRVAENEVEKIGIKKSMELAKEADLVIAIFDGSKKLDEQDYEILNMISGKTSIIVLNKVDLQDGGQEQEARKQILEVEGRGENIEGQRKIVELSALKKIGIEELYEAIKELYDVDKISVEGENIVTNVRHQGLIQEAINNINKAIEDIKNNITIDIIAIYIKNILDSLSKITGENISEDIINEIFSKFCLGK